MSPPPHHDILPILDVGPSLPPERVVPLARALLAAGAPWLQLRGKRSSARELLDLARALRALTRAHGAHLVINDRPDVALLAEADGVHLGQDDLPAHAVRAWLPASIYIGVSTHHLEQVQAVAAEGIARYVGFGPVYPTTTKEAPAPVVGLGELAAAVRAYPGLPVVAIGGITAAHAHDVAAVGASGAAMISAILAAPDPAAALRAARAAFAAGARAHAREPATGGLR